MDTKIEETSLTDIKIMETGRILVKASTLNEIVQKMSGELVKFSKADLNILLLESEDSNYKLNLLSDEKYEKAIFNNDMEEKVEISAKKFNNSVAKVIFAGSEYHSKFIYQGLNLLIKDNNMITTVCDGIRIASNKEKITSDKYLNKIIPLRVVKELVKVLPESKTYKFSFTNNKGIVVAGNMINQFSLIEGTFPVFDKFFNTEAYDKILNIKKNNLDNAIERATVLNSNKADGSNRVGIKISNELLVIESREQEIGTAKIELKDFAFKGEKIEISISPKIIREGLRFAESEDISIYLTTNQSSVLLKTKEEGLNYLMSPMM